jgi:hypothetical protein
MSRFESRDRTDSIPTRCMPFGQPTILKASMPPEPLDFPTYSRIVNGQISASAGNPVPSIW